MQVVLKTGFKDFYFYMSFDYIFKYFWLSNYFERFVSSKNDNLLMKRYFKHVKDSKELVVVLHGWKSISFIDKLFNARVIRSGKSCLAYSFLPEILSPDPDYTLEGFKKIKGEARRDIASLKKQFKYSKINLIAPSLGVVSAMMIANGNDDIDELSLIVPGNCLASSLWHGIRTQKLRKIYEKRGINSKKLQELWKELAPENNSDSLKNKEINVYISKSDKVIPYEYGKEFADCLVGRCKKLQVEENPILGHYLSVVKFYFFNDFLCSKK